MRPAVKPPFYRAVVEPSHQFCAKQPVHGVFVYFAVVIPDALQIGEHVSVRGVVTGALDEATSRDSLAFERRKIDGTAVLHVGGFRGGRREMKQGDRRCKKESLAPFHAGRPSFQDQDVAVVVDRPRLQSA